MIEESIITYLVFLIVFDIFTCNWFQMMTKYYFYNKSAARLERKSFFVAGKALAKRLGVEDGLSCPNYIYYF